MEPQIQYARTKDAVNIAYWTLGKGTPLIHMPLQFSHTQLEWQLDECRRWYESLARKRMLVSYNDRGSGLSGRNVSDYSVDALLLDLNAVVERVGLKRFDLLGMMDTGPASLAYAARHPDRVSHLVLWCTYAKGSHLLRAPETPGLLALMDKDWNLFTETWANAFVGWGQSELSRRLAALWRECCSPEIVQVFWPATLEYDVARLLPHVKTPTLVLHPRRLRFLPMDVATELASGIPNARLTILEGFAAAFLEDAQMVAKAIDEFLGEGEEEATAHAGGLPVGTAVILFLDIAESTALTERLGDASFRAQAGELDGSLRATIREAGGTPVEGKVLGDGVMATFTSARQAIDCALRCNALGAEAGLPLHHGIHAGDVIREGGNVYGGVVNIAARLADASAAGEILVSETVRGLARTSAGVAFEDRGEHELKGITEPQRLFAVRKQESRR